MQRDRRDYPTAATNERLRAPSAIATPFVEDHHPCVKGPGEEVAFLEAPPAMQIVALDAAWGLSQKHERPWKGRTYRTFSRSRQRHCESLASAPATGFLERFTMWRSP